VDESVPFTLLAVGFWFVGTETMSTSDSEAQETSVGRVNALGIEVKADDSPETIRALENLDARSEGFEAAVNVLHEWGLNGDGHLFRRAGLEEVLVKALDNAMLQRPEFTQLLSVLTQQDYSTEQCAPFTGLVYTNRVADKIVLRLEVSYAQDLCQRCWQDVASFGQDERGRGLLAAAGAFRVVYEGVKKNSPKLMTREMAADMLRAVYVLGKPPADLDAALVSSMRVFVEAMEKQYPGDPEFEDLCSDGNFSFLE
jgi:hypothetical protein